MKQCLGFVWCFVNGRGVSAVGCSEKAVGVSCIWGMSGVRLEAWWVAGLVYLLRSSFFRWEASSSAHEVEGEGSVSGK